MEEFPVALAHLDELEGKPDARNMPPYSHHNPEHFLTHGDPDAAQGPGLQGLRTANQQARLAHVNQVARKTGRGAHECDGHLMDRAKAYCSSTCHVLEPSLLIVIWEIQSRGLLPR